MRCGKVRKQKVVYRNGKVGLTRIRASSVEPTEETVHVQIEKVTRGYFLISFKILLKYNIMVKWGGCHIVPRSQLSAQELVNTRQLR